MAKDTVLLYRNRNSDTALGRSGGVQAPFLGVTAEKCDEDEHFEAPEGR